MDPCIYIISFPQDHRVYVGSTAHPRMRKSGHLNKLRAKVHSSPELQKCYELYGEDNFCFSIIEKGFPKEMLREKEQTWINYYLFKLLNNSKNANGPTEMTASFKKKCKDRMTGNSIRNGKKMPTSAKKAISESLKGNKFRKGKPHDEQIKNKISNSLKNAYKNGLRKPVMPEQNGENNPMSKLTKNKVIEIRKLSGTDSEIASKYGVSRRNINLIRSHKTWRNI